MAVSPEHYHDAAFDRLGEAQALMEAGYSSKGNEHYYVGATYLSGVAIEAMLSAFYPRGTSFAQYDHDLRQLAKSSPIHGKLRGNEPERLGEHLTTANNHWANAQRYYSEKLLREFILKRWPGLKTKGSILKLHASELIKAAEHIIQIGEAAWKRP